jgi:hypothetical protein
LVSLSFSKFLPGHPPHAAEILKYPEASGPWTLTLFSPGLANLKFQEGGDLLLCTSNVFGKAPKGGLDLESSVFSTSTKPIIHIDDGTWYFDSAIWINGISRHRKAFKDFSLQK